MAQQVIKAVKRAAPAEHPRKEGKMGEIIETALRTTQMLGPSALGIAWFVFIGTDFRFPLPLSIFIAVLLGGFCSAGIAALPNEPNEWYKLLVWWGAFAAPFILEANIDRSPVDN